MLQSDGIYGVNYGAFWSESECIMIQFAVLILVTERPHVAGHYTQQVWFHGAQLRHIIEGSFGGFSLSATRTCS